MKTEHKIVCGDESIEANGCKLVSEPYNGRITVIYVIKTIRQFDQPNEFEDCALSRNVTEGNFNKPFVCHRCNRVVTLLPVSFPETIPLERIPDPPAIF